MRFENNYSKACTEILKIIDLLSIEDYKKIPKDIIKIFEENKDKNYIFKYDYSKNLMEQDIDDITRGFISNLYIDYLANEEEKKEIFKIEQIQINEDELNKRLKYNPDNLFNKIEATKSNNIIKNNNLPIEIKKENFYLKLKKFIFKLLKIK